MPLLFCNYGNKNESYNGEMEDISVNETGTRFKLALR